MDAKISGLDNLVFNEWSKLFVFSDLKVKLVKKRRNCRFGCYGTFGGRIQIHKRNTFDQYLRKY